jgi:hypothetical protein
LTKLIFNAKYNRGKNMSKVYTYSKNGVRKTYEASDNEQKYLELNEKVTGILPSEFISICAKNYEKDSIADAVRKGMNQNLKTIKTIQQYGEVKLNLNYSDVQAELDEMTRNLNPSKEKIEEITRFVRGK